jgi:hypothetical protein
MVSGKCPHPWNKNKKGSFEQGHSVLNNGKGCFKKGMKLPDWLIEANKIRMTENYELGKHPFCELNKIAFENRLKTNWYGLGKAKWKALSKHILERDNYHCLRCSKEVNKYSYNCHHKIPYEVSGNNSDDNLRTLCVSCHIIEEWEARKQLSQKSQITKDLNITTVC